MAQIARVCDALGVEGLHQALRTRRCSERAAGGHDRGPLQLSDRPGQANRHPDGDQWTPRSSLAPVPLEVRRAFEPSAA